VNLTAIALEKRAISYFAIFLIVVGGIYSYFQLGQLEDPDFSVKTAAIVTTYPGASAKEVELEVTDRIELAIQQMTQLKNVYSMSRPGFSLIKVDIAPQYWSNVLPQVWDELRKKIRDVRDDFPPGVSTPKIADDYGDVFGMLFAVTGDGFNYSELETHVKDIQKELLLVKGVAKIVLWGEQPKAIYVDISESQLANLGFTPEELAATLQFQNKVVQAGQVDVQSERLRIAPTGAFKRPEDIGNLTLRSLLLGRIQGQTDSTGRDSLLRIRDIAEVRRGYRDPPNTLMRFNGKNAIGMAISPLGGTNVVKVGEAVEERLNELVEHLPVGVEVNQVAFQPTEVKESIRSFMINLLQAIVIVLLVLTLPMGFRMGLIIGTALVFTISGTFMVMFLLGIDLQRMSLGALIIAMGMMVDNSIVVADGFLVRTQQGMDRKKAAIESAFSPSWPLLGATVVAVMAFFPIFASVEGVGEYCRTLFQVVGISLILSWVLSMTLTPLQCLDMLPPPKVTVNEADAYNSGFYRVYKGFLERAIRFRGLSIAAMAALLVLSVVGFGNLDRTFFPFSSRMQFMVDYWLPEGSRIQDVSKNIKRIEAKLMKDPRVKNVSSFIGQGPPRFYLPVQPEDPYTSYAQMIVNTKTLKDVNDLINEIKPWLDENVDEAMMNVRRFCVGPCDAWQFVVRFSGPAEADPEILRDLAAQAALILDKSPMVKIHKTDWRERVKEVVPDYNQERARWSGVTREDMANAFLRSYDGMPVGTFREGDDLIPIILRNPEEERSQVPARLDQLQIWPSMSTKTVPMSQVTRNIQVRWEDPMIWRWDRRRAISVQAKPEGVTFPTLFAAVQKDFEAIKLPPGYRLEWDGEYGSSKEAQASLLPGLAPTVVIILFVIVALFNNYRQPLIIICLVPFVLIGITLGLLVFKQPFGFLALLGAMSLAGMMIKNSIVLLDQVNLEQEAGKSPYEAVVVSALSRLRPVGLAAGTTILGVIPLLQDVFWVAMAVTIMAGLAFGTIITMVFLPVLYCTFYKVPSPVRYSKNAVD
jgi:multidrug efflux pump subunit AcrB